MAPREYDTPIRDARKAQTREAILQALAEVVIDEGVASLSMQQIADRAGVSHRTVYRHFEDRQALLDALQTWVQQRLQPPMRSHEIDAVETLLETVPGIFQRFDELGPPAAAMARISVAEDQRTGDHDARTETFRDLLLAELADRHDDPDAVFAVLRHLLSAVTWWVGHAEFGLDGQRTGAAVATVIRTVITARPTSHTRS